jgi:hypothetical protein
MRNVFAILVAIFLMALPVLAESVITGLPAGYATINDGKKKELENVIMFQSPEEKLAVRITGLADNLGWNNKPTSEWLNADSLVANRRAEAAAAYYHSLGWYVEIAGIETGTPYRGVRVEIVERVESEGAIAPPEQSAPETTLTPAVAPQPQITGFVFERPVISLKTDNKIFGRVMAETENGLISLPNNYQVTFTSTDSENVSVEKSGLITALGKEDKESQVIATVSHQEAEGSMSRKVVTDAVATMTVYVSSPGEMSPPPTKTRVYAGIQGSDSDYDTGGGVTLGMEAPSGASMLVMADWYQNLSVVTAGVGMKLPWLPLTPMIGFRVDNNLNWRPMALANLRLPISERISLNVFGGAEIFSQNIPPSYDFNATRNGDNVDWQSSFNPGGIKREIRPFAGIGVTFDLTGGVK